MYVYYDLNRCVYLRMCIAFTCDKECVCVCVSEHNMWVFSVYEHVVFVVTGSTVVTEFGRMTHNVSVLLAVIN